MNSARDWESRRLELLRRISYSEPVQDVLHALAKTATEFVSSRGCAILLVKGNKLVVNAGSGFSAGQLATLENLPVSYLHKLFMHLPESDTDFSVRSIVSGAGEVLGAMILGDVEQGEKSPDPLQMESRVSCLESLAALTIEYHHVLAELQHAQEHDSLTQVYDRLTIDRHIAEALAATFAGPSGRRVKVGLIALAIDRLRRINGALGHHVGNQLLREAAKRLQVACGRTALLGRAGGDEFLISIPQLASADQAAGLAERLLGSLRRTFVIGDYELRITASAGIGISSPEAFRSEDLETRTFAALEHAKSLGGNQSAFFDCSMAIVSPEYLEMEGRLRGALSGQELLLFYQPQLALHDYSTVGVEALLRWQHPVLGLVSPVSFIPMAEQGGLISEIGEWAIEQGIRQLLAWRKWGVGNLRMGINVSPVQFRRRDFTRRILDILDRTGFDSGDLLLEITEGTIMQDLDFAVAQMNRLREAGIGFGIDDFGTGYSSLSYLQRLPANQLKVDRSFVRTILCSGQRAPLLENVLRLARELGINTIAEGIETQEQADLLVALGCQEGQGFLFSRPLPGIEMISWFRRAGRLIDTPTPQQIPAVW